MRKLDSGMIIEMYTKKEMTLDSIADHFGCSRTPIWDLLKKNDIARTHTRKKRHKLPAEEIINLYVINKESCNSISKRYNCCGITIGKILKDNNIKTRATGEHLIGTKKSDEFKKHQSELMKGEKNPQYGKRPAQETIDNLIKINKARTGEKHHNKDGHIRPPSWKGKKLTNEHKQNCSLAKIGKLNPNYGKNGELNTNWREGISFEPYCHKFNKKLKDTIKKQHRHTCFNCKKRYDNKHLCIHHIDYDKNDLCNGKMWSLLPLCRTCNSKANFNRWWWFNKLMNYWAQNDEINWNMLDR